MPMCTTYPMNACKMYIYRVIILFVATAGYLTDLYARTDWSAFRCTVVMQKLYKTILIKKMTIHFFLITNQWFYTFFFVFIITTVNIDFL